MIYLLFKEIHVESNTWKDEYLPYSV